MDSSGTTGYQPNPGSDEATWRAELSNLLDPSTFPCTGEDALVALLRVHAPSRLLQRLGGVPPGMRFLCVELLVAHISAEANRQRQHAGNGESDLL
ncbi:hypothetical protein [Lapillicoccus sp.]|uniref:hypothetical protein n=1 Tax=Lapillicoccus sp. TaxID=1909287 RepID=UPI0032669AC2